MKHTTLLETSLQLEVYKKNIWASKVAKIPILGISRLLTWESWDKMTFGCNPRDQGTSTNTVLIAHDALPSPLLNSLKGPTMQSCGKLGLGGRSRLLALKGGRGVCSFVPPLFRVHLGPPGSSVLPPQLISTGLLDLRRAPPIRCRNPSLGSRPRQGGCKVAGL